MSQLIRQYEQSPFVAKLFGALVLIGGSTYYAWDEYITPKVYIIEGKDAEKTKIEDELKAINRDFVSPVSMEEELTVANREFKKLVESLPQDSSLDRVLNDFASLSRVTGSEIREFKPGSELKALPDPTKPQPTNQIVPPPQNNNINDKGTAVKELDDVNAIGIQVKMFGTFTALISFLDLAMSMPRVVRLQDFQIVNPEKQIKLTQRPKLTFSGFFYAYFQKPDIGKIPETAGTTASTSPTGGNEKSRTRAIGQPAIDLNKLIDGPSLSAKPLEGEQK